MPSLELLPNKFLFEKKIKACMIVINYTGFLFFYRGLAGILK